MLPIHRNGITTERSSICKGSLRTYMEEQAATFVPYQHCETFSAEYLWCLGVWVWGNVIHATNELSCILKTVPFSALLTVECWPIFAAAKDFDRF